MNESIHQQIFVNIKQRKRCTLSFTLTSPNRNFIKQRTKNFRHNLAIVTKTPHEYIRVTYKYIRVTYEYIRVHTSNIRDTYQ